MTPDYRTARQFKAGMCITFEGSGTAWMDCDPDSTYAGEVVARKLAEGKAALDEALTENARLTAGIESVIALSKREVDGEVTYLPAGAQALIILMGSNRPLERAQAKLDAADEFIQAFVIQEAQTNAWRTGQVHRWCTAPGCVVCDAAAYLVRRARPR